MGSVIILHCMTVKEIKVGTTYIGRWARSKPRTVKSIESGIVAYFDNHASDRTELLTAFARWALREVTEVVKP